MSTPIRSNPDVKRSLFREVTRTAGLALLAIGIDVRKLTAFRSIPKYLGDRRAFRKSGGVIANTYPVLNDFCQPAGAIGGHYFHQDLLVASFVRDSAPIRHIDVGSRIDGFVAHVASFRPIEVIDVRPLADAGHENITFMQADLMSEDADRVGITDSLSCLHALEHFGLGRYGDPVDPEGHIRGFRNLCAMVRPGGTVYISVPVGRETAVSFNAHRVFHPTELLSWADGIVELVRFDFVDDQGTLHRRWPLPEEVPDATFGCGIYTLKKL